MNTTVKHVGSKREREGPLENWKAHSLVIKHWCDGGEGLVLNSDNEWKDVDEYSRFTPGVEYKIKQRKPKNGEVWVVDGNPFGSCLNCGGTDAKEQPTWNGEGLPPVGTVCEYRGIYGRWKKVEVLCIRAEYFWLYGPEESEYYSAYVNIDEDAEEFRPIRTEREIQVEAIDKLLSSNLSISEMAEVLYYYDCRVPVK